MPQESSTCFLSLKEAAIKLGRSPQSTRRLIDRLLLPRDPNSRHLAIPSWSVAEYIRTAGQLEPQWWEARPYNTQR